MISLYPLWSLQKQWRNSLNLAKHYQNPILLLQWDLIGDQNFTCKKCKDEVNRKGHLVKHQYSYIQFFGLCWYSCGKYKRCFQSQQGHGLTYIANLKEHLANTQAYKTLVLLRFMWWIKKVILVKYTYGQISWGTILAKSYVTFSGSLYSIVWGHIMSDFQTVFFVYQIKGV